MSVGVRLCGSGRLTSNSLCLSCIVFVILPILAIVAAEPRDQLLAPPPQLSSYLASRQRCSRWGVEMPSDGQLRVPFEQVLKIGRGWLVLGLVRRAGYRLRDVGRG